MDLDNISEIVEESTNIGSKKQKRAPKQQVYNNLYDSEELGELVFGESITPDVESVYDAKEDYEKMKKVMTNEEISRSNLPDFIKQSFNEKQIDLSTISSNEDFTKTLQNNEGIQKSANLFKRLESYEESSDDLLEETAHDYVKRETPRSNSSNIDYSLIKTIINESVKENFEKLKAELLEDKSLYVMKLGKKFLLMDNEDNIYECQLEFKRKNKKKK